EQPLEESTRNVSGCAKDGARDVLLVGAFTSQSQAGQKCSYVTAVDRVMASVSGGYRVTEKLAHDPTELHGYKLVTRGHHESGLLREASIAHQQAQQIS